MATNGERTIMYSHYVTLLWAYFECLSTRIEASKCVFHILDLQSKEAENEQKRGFAYREWICALGYILRRVEKRKGGNCNRREAFTAFLFKSIRELITFHHEFE